MSDNLPRVGFGFDAHALVPGRPLVLGGVRIPFDWGLDGHSDADVVSHALIDALLGAAGQGDIGGRFPDDPRWEGASSLDLLRLVAAELAGVGWRLGNADLTVVAQRPRLSSALPEMRVCLAGAMAALGGALNLKATTTDGLGFTGRGEGIAAYAVVLIVGASGPTPWGLPSVGE